VDDPKIEIERAWQTVKRVLRMLIALKRLWDRETQIGNLKSAENTLVILRTSKRLC